MKVTLILQMSVRSIVFCDTRTRAAPSRTTLYITLRDYSVQIIINSCDQSILTINYFNLRFHRDDDCLSRSISHAN